MRMEPDEVTDLKMLSVFSSLFLYKKNMAVTPFPYIILNCLSPQAINLKPLGAPQPGLNTTTFVLWDGTWALSA